MTDENDARPDPEAERRARAEGQEVMAFQAAMAGDYRAYLEATVTWMTSQRQWLAERSIGLAVEVLKRDERIVELEARLAELEPAPAVIADDPEGEDPWS